MKKKRQRIRLFFERGMTTGSFPVALRDISFEGGSVCLCYLLMKPGIRSVSGWPLRETHIPRSMYRFLLKIMKRACLSRERSEVIVSTSEDGRDIILSVHFCDPSLLCGIDRSFGIFHKKQKVFFPFSRRLKAMDSAWEE